MVNSITFNKINSVKNNNRQDKKQTSTQEGVLVNNFIKTEYGASLYVPPDSGMPEDLNRQKEKISKGFLNSTIFPLIAAPLAILGIGVALSTLHRNSFLKKQAIKKDNLLPNIGRMITINDDTMLVLYLLVQDPTPKSLIAATGVITASAAGFVMKNVVDGFKDIWIKKQEADIKRDLEESLIEIETRSFSGKTRIIRNMISKHAKELNPVNSNKVKQNIEFKGTNQDLFSAFTVQPSFKQKSNKNVVDKNWFYVAAGTATFIGASLLALLMFKNLGKVAKEYNKFQETASKEFNKGLSKLSEDDLKTKLSSMSVKQEIKTFISQSWCEANNKPNSIFEVAPTLMGGHQNKISIVSAVRDKTAFLYTYIMNPNPQTRNLLLLTAGSTAIGYIGKTVVEGIKDIQVIKANAETERQFQDRLVQVELNNFLAKKTSYINPLVEDYERFRKEHPEKQDSIEKMYINIIEETKNGPPFVYS